LRLQDPENARDRLVEFLPFALQMLPAGWGDGVDAGAASILRYAPFGLDAVIDEEPLEREIEGAFADFERITGGLAMASAMP
jgi:hypothetical protein